MKRMDTDEEMNRVSETVIGCAFMVHNRLGRGFAERVYENAIMIEFKKAGLAARQQVPIVVQDDGVVVGEYCADLIVESLVMVELKSVRNFDDGHYAQCLNYLAATTIPLCLLLNFGNRVEIKRFRRPIPS